MKYFLIFLLLIPFANALAVTPTTVSDSFFVINNLDEKADYIVKSGNHEEHFSLTSFEQKELTLNQEYSDKIYIYEIHDIHGLGVANSVKISVDKEKSQRLNLSEVKFGKSYDFWIYIVVAVVLLSGAWIFRKRIKELFA